MKSSAAGTLLAFVLTISATAQAQDTANAEASALQTILQFAHDLCGKVPTEGKAQNWKASAEASADLNGLLKKIANLGLKLGAETSSASYQGVLREDLGKVLINQTTCKKDVAALLMDRVYPLPQKPVVCDPKDFKPFLGKAGLEMQGFKTAFTLQTQLPKSVPDGYKDDHPACFQARQMAVRIKELDTEFRDFMVEEKLSYKDASRTAFGQPTLENIAKEQRQLALKLMQIESLRKKQEGK